MPPPDLSKNSVRDIFYAPVLQVLKDCRNNRKGLSFTDSDFLIAGVGRCIADVRSGRDWVQRAQAMLLNVNVANFFKSLKSERRLKVLKEVATVIRKEVDASAPLSEDPFGDHDEMNNFAVYAADGHYHGASSHETEIEGKKRPVGHLFAMNLRTQSMHHLDITRPKRKREHELSLLKRLESNALRMGEPKGRQVILAYDPAIYNFQQWYNWKQSKGIYVITRNKETTQLLTCWQNEFDAADPRNAGVVSDVTGGATTGHMLRKIVYVDPATNVEYRFLTNEMTLPPGLIAFIYKKRWDIEKVYDEYKNRLMEKKAWAKSPNSKSIQGQFMALAHNLLLLLERRIAAEEGIVDTKISQSRKRRIKKQIQQIKEAKRQINPLPIKAYRAVQRSLQFLRWLRVVLLAKTTWRASMDLLRPLMLKYL